MDKHEQLSRAKVKLSVLAPYFTELCYSQNLQFIRHPSIRFTVSKGTIYFEESYFCSLRLGEQLSLLLHTCLHKALRHRARQGERLASIWNLACDTVVNSIICSTTTLPSCKHSFYSTELSKYSAEEAYDVLLVQQCGQPSANRIENGSENLMGDGNESATAFEPDITRESNDWEEPVSTMENTNDIGIVSLRLEENLQEAFHGYGSLPAGIVKELTAVNVGLVSWRDLLWRYLSKSMDDFSGFDRRFIHQGLYLDALENDDIRLWVCIDTSESISTANLRLFLGEVVSIIDMYPRVIGRLFYCDTELYGPFPLIRNFEPPRGRGGTSFSPFFQYVNTQCFNKPNVLIYFTDGLCEYPTFKVDTPTLWMIDNIGFDNIQQPPFGEVVRITMEKYVW